MDSKDDVRDAAEAEIQQLQADLVKNPDPREVRLRKLQQVLEILSADRADDMAWARACLSSSSLHPQENTPKRTKTEIIADAAEKFLRENPGWQMASTIYRALVNQGIEIGGQNPKGNLTAHMSSSGRFVSDRISGRGWRLKSAEEAEKPERGGENRSSSSEPLRRPFFHAIQ